SPRGSAVEEGNCAVRAEHDRTIIVSNCTLDITLNRVEIAPGHVDLCAHRAAAFAPRQPIQETRAGRHRRAARHGVVGLDTRIALDQYVGGLRKRGCRNASWERMEKC